MTAADGAAVPTPALAAAPRPGDALLVARSGPFRLLVPLDRVERVLPAALPAVRASSAGAAHPVVQVGEALLPVVFAEALLGAGEVRLRPGDQLLQLSDGGRRALLWIGAAEEVVPCRPLAPPPGPAPDLVAGYAEADGALAVLDVPGAVGLAHGAPREAP